MANEYKKIDVPKALYTANGTFEIVNDFVGELFFEQTPYSRLGDALFVLE